AEMVHGNGFIAAFCSGLTLGNTSREASAVEEFSEAEGQLLTLLVFLVFGGTLLPHSLAAVGVRTWLYALASLTVVRMLPVALSLLGKGLRPETVLYLGWFGPRGIASILFALLLVEQTAPGQHERLIPIVMVTVLLSTVVHGVTSYPFSKAYGRRHGGEVTGKPEHVVVREMPLRLPLRTRRD
ncbi:MAG: cation:proton antiporter, partial [Acidobacteria bacterium]|nr:cation:proton antiporter [Acidobacteriota bacterium]